MPFSIFFYSEGVAIESEGMGGTAELWVRGYTTYSGIAPIDQTSQEPLTGCKYLYTFLSHVYDSSTAIDELDI